MPKLRAKPETIQRWLRKMNFRDASREYSGSRDWQVWEHNEIQRVVIGVHIGEGGNEENFPPFWLRTSYLDEPYRTASFKALRVELVTRLITLGDTTHG